MVFFEVEVAERLPIRIAHDEAVVEFFNCPWGWKAPSRHNRMIALPSLIRAASITYLLSSKAQWDKAKPKGGLGG